MADDSTTVNRRTLLQLLPASLLANVASADAGHQCGSSPLEAKAARPYEFRFFTPDEVNLFNSVADQIIPADDHSPGALQADTVEFADLMISTGPDYLRDDWHSGLRLLAAQLKASDLPTWLSAVTQQEDNPQTVLEIFFRTLKQMIVNGYYSSEIGIHRELQYQGNTYLTAFPGCQHPEHKE